MVGVITLRPDEASGRTTQGIAFALPSSVVVSALDQLERYGKVSHPILGVNLTQDGTAASVSSVTSGSAAQVAGLKAGDVITMVDGHATTQASQVIAAVVGHRAGDDVNVTVTRGDVEKVIRVHLKERPAS